MNNMLCDLSAVNDLGHSPLFLDPFSVDLEGRPPFGTERQFQKNNVLGRAEWQIKVFELQPRHPRIRYRR